MNLFRTNFMGQMRQSLGSGGYMYLVDLPPQDGQPRNSEPMYWIFVENGGDPDFSGVCEVSPGVTVGGIVGYLPTGGNLSAVSMRKLGLGDRPLLQRICDGLRRPLSWLRQGDAQQPQRSDHTVYDYLVRDAPTLIIALMPARIQGEDAVAGLATNFWASALVGRYHRMPTSEEIIANPDAFEQMASFQNGELANMPLPILPRPRANASADPYPPESRREFGERIQALHDDWLRYLSAAAVTIRGRRVPLMNNGRPVAVLPTFSADDIGTPAFWLASNDFPRTSEMVACIAGRFLSDRHHVEANQADMGRCDMSETSLSR
jgi:hypothetical protein